MRLLFTIIMLLPKRVKYRKMQKGRMRGVAYRGSDFNFGKFAMQALECGWVYNFQLEAARVALSRHIKRGGKIWIRVFPDKPLTAKSFLRLHLTDGQLDSSPHRGHWILSQAIATDRLFQ